MADQEDTKGAAQPPFDPAAILGRLEGIVNDNKSSKGGGKSWISTLIIIAVALMGVAVFAWISFRNNRELAKLRHEKEKARILAEKAVVDAKVAANDAARAEAEKKRAEVEEKIRHIEADVRTENARYEADLRSIDRIRSWRDVDPGSGG
jgi:uncharacterized protein HemX